MKIKEDRTRTPRRRPVVWLLSITAAMGLLWGGNAFYWRYHAKRFQVLREGVFYRTGQPTEPGLRLLIDSQRVKTVVSLQLFDPQLKKGMLDFGSPDGRLESELVTQLGARHVQWPMGEEAGWPWLTPWQFEEFFKLLDEPANWPVAVHCAGGRHRTGTLAALFRLEYDRWPVERALQEMYSWEFGLPITTQEHNLRTYLPRPHPNVMAWSKLQHELGPLVGLAPNDDYEGLVRRLRAARGDAKMQAAMAKRLDSGVPFAVAMAQRLVDKPEDALARTATAAARRVLNETEADEADWAMAAALVADYGMPDEQAELLNLLAEGVQEPAVTPRYAAIFAGVTNRYTPNRVAFLRPLLDDTRQRIEPAASKYRYCDTAMVRLAVIIDKDLLIGASSVPQNWEDARQSAIAWIAGHPRETALSTLQPPQGNNLIRAQRGQEEEDLSRMRR